MNQDKFRLRFDKNAQKEYDKLDGSVKGHINKGLAKLRRRADTIGKELGNKREMKLNGCKELKFRESGIRIIYRITGQKEDLLEIVMILGIGDRAEDKAFKDASDRLEKFLNHLKD
ncbi:type II toxin-antitoxin system RelE/ParE family toxin [Exiguobacterium acetylicum]|uniref:type II toxin-antitoxin system RelE/ParE family toxin n=1 Tax=Exiguobacterium acetylicum TaxID=41170 RepID=UPI0034D7A794